MALSLWQPFLGGVLLFGATWWQSHELQAKNPTCQQQLTLSLKKGITEPTGRDLPKVT